MELDRRKFLGVLGALALSACAPARRSAEGSGSTPSGSKDSAKSPDKTIDPTERIAKQMMFDEWRILFSSEQESGNTRFAMEITNPDIWTNDRFQELLKNGKDSQNIPLAVKWTAIQTQTLGNQFAGSKWFGEIEFNDIKIGFGGSKLTDSVNVANGYQWSGQLQIDFTRRSRSIYDTHQFGWISNKDAFQKWISTQTPSQPLPNFSDWAIEKWNASSVLRNGVWTINTPKTDPGGGPLLEAFKLPSKVLEQTCRVNGTYCRQVVTELR